MLGEKKIVSANHLDNSCKINSVNGDLLHSIHASTNIVTCVVTQFNTIFTGSKDSSIFSFNYSSNSICLNLRFLGHLFSITQLALLYSYQLLASLADNGDILVHEIRTAECLHAIHTNYTGICISNLKIILGYNTEEAQEFDLQGCSLRKRNFGMDFAKFDQSGENLLFFKYRTWGFFSLFDSHKKFEKTEENPVNAIQISIDQNYFIYSELQEKYSFVYTFEVMKPRKIY